MLPRQIAEISFFKKLFLVKYDNSDSVFCVWFCASYTETNNESLNEL